jgi:Spy/CpxP family protein refolding chaperone
MRLIMLLSLFLVSLSLPVVAQDKDEKKAEKRSERRRGPGGMGDPKRMVEFLDKELDLDESQKEAIGKIFEEVMADTMAKAGEYFGSGDPQAREKARKLFEDVRITISKRINAVLTPSQRKQFAVMVEQFDRRANKFEQGRIVEDDVTQLLNPKPSSKRILLAKAESLLFLPPEETAAILPFVEKVVERKLGLYEGRKVRRKDLLNATRAKASKQEIQARLVEIRTAERFQRLELLAAQAELKELLTLEQEVRFVAAGIIE